MLRLLSGAALLATALTARAEDSAFNYVYVDAGYDRVRERESGLLSDGFTLGASLDVGEHGFVQASFSGSKSDSFERDGVAGRFGDTVFGAGVGGHVPLSERADLIGSIGWMRASTRGYDGFAGDAVERREGATAYLGVRYLLTDRLELSAGPGYSYIGRQPGWDASASLGFALVGDLWLDGTYWTAEGLEGWSVGLRAPLGGGASDDDEEDYEDEDDDADEAGAEESS